MSKESSTRGTILAATLVVAVIFQIFLSILILFELRQLPNKLAGIVPRGSVRGLDLGSEAPAFSLPGSQGSKVSLADFFGQKVMLVFSSEQCKFCREMYPELRQLRSKEEYSGVQMVMLQLGSTPEENRVLRNEQGLDFPILVAGPDTFSSYKVPGTPFATLVSEAGMIVGSGIGGSYETLASLLNDSLMVN